MFLTLENTYGKFYIIIYHFIAFELNLGVTLSFALIKPAACISQIKKSSELEVVLSLLEVAFTIKSKVTLVQWLLKHLQS